MHRHISIIYERSELAVINLQTSVGSLPSPLPSSQPRPPLSGGMLICMRPAGFCMWATLLSPCCITLEKVRKRDSGDVRFSQLSWIQLPLTQGELSLLSSVQMLQIPQHASTSAFTTAQLHHTAQPDSLRIKPRAGSALFLQLISDELAVPAFNSLEFSVNTS